MILNLERGSMATVDLDDDNCLVQCAGGRLWITVAGDPGDYFMEGSDERLFSGPGRMVIEALDRACLGIHSESLLRVKISEDYCPPAGAGAEPGSPLRRHRAFGRKHPSPSAIVLIQSGSGSA